MWNKVKLGDCIYQDKKTINKFDGDKLHFFFSRINLFLLNSSKKEKRIPILSS